MMGTKGTDQLMKLVNVIEDPTKFRAKIAQLEKQTKDSNTRVTLANQAMADLKLQEEAFEREKVAAQKRIFDKEKELDKQVKEYQTLISEKTQELEKMKSLLETQREKVSQERNAIEKIKADVSKREAAMKSAFKDLKAREDKLEADRLEIERKKALLSKL